MKKSILLLLVGLIAAGLMFPQTMSAQRKNVTFIVNTATVPDTINPASAVYITGATSKGDTLLTNWGNGVAFTNVGGDYWAKTLSLQEGDTLNYKIKIYGGGWEENIVGPLANNNRNFFVPTTDTTLPTEFWNNGNFPSGKNIGMYDKPYTTVSDSFVSVYVRVNIKGVQDGGTYGYTPADQDSVCILGDGGHLGPDLDWGTPFYLKQEAAPSNSGTAFGMPANTFYSGRIRFYKDSLTAGKDVSYKFRFGSQWSLGATQRSEQLSSAYAGGNRHWVVPAKIADTTLQWVYFGDTKPIPRANPDTCVITFYVDASQAIDKGGFSQGDTLQVQSGFFNTAAVNPKTTQLQLQIGALYSVTDTIITKIGSVVDYQFYLQKLGQSIRENYYNFAYNGPTPSEAERRQFVVPSKKFSIFDTAYSVTSLRRQPEFRNYRKLAHAVRVHFELDVRPAFYQIAKGDTLSAIQGSTNIYQAVKDSILKWGVWINGPALGGWGNPNATDWGSGLYNNPLKKMYDDGTHGDRIAHDSIFTLTILDSPDSVIAGGTRDVVGQEFKFGIYGSDNEGGKGGYGNNHNENVVDVDTAYTILSQFGSINPAFYSAWDYDHHRPATTTGVILPGVAKVFALEQNYPNPFNPTTAIKFSIPQNGLVTLKVFNILGQEVSTLVHDNMVAGNHEVMFDAHRMASGVYFYMLSAGSNVSTKKMLLLK